MPILRTYHCLFADLTSEKTKTAVWLIVRTPINNKLFNFAKTSVHMILYLLNWNLFARHKDSLAESTSCSIAEIVQKMDRVPFVCWPILFHGGDSEGHRMSSCSNLRELCTCSARRSDSHSSRRGWGLSEPALKASEVPDYDWALSQVSWSIWSTFNINYMQ